MEKGGKGEEYRKSRRKGQQSEARRDREEEEEEGRGKNMAAELNYERQKKAGRKNDSQEKQHKVSE